jgi:hypothetical protein
MKNVVIFLAVVVLAFLFSCKQENPALTGGKGGNAVLKITPVHFGLNVDSCTVYIKYAASEKPANNIYDDSAQCVLQDTVPVAIFPHLTNGQYYIFGNGYHKFYNAYVEGGVSLSINVQDTISYQLPTSAYYKF